MALYDPELDVVGTAEQIESSTVHRMLSPNRPQNARMLFTDFVRTSSPTRVRFTSRETRRALG
jgi:hypothetical protein